MAEAAALQLRFSDGSVHFFDPGVAANMLSGYAVGAEFVRSRRILDLVVKYAEELVAGRLSADAWNRRLLNFLTDTDTLYDLFLVGHRIGSGVSNVASADRAACPRLLTRSRCLLQRTPDAHRRSRQCVGLADVGRLDKRHNGAACNIHQSPAVASGAGDVEEVEEEEEAPFIVRPGHAAAAERAGRDGGRHGPAWRRVNGRAAAAARAGSGETVAGIPLARPEVA